MAIQGWRLNGIQCVRGLNKQAITAFFSDIESAPMLNTSREFSGATIIQLSFHFLTYVEDNITGDFKGREISQYHNYIWVNQIFYHQNTMNRNSVEWYRSIKAQY